MCVDGLLVLGWVHTEDVSASVEGAIGTDTLREAKTRSLTSGRIGEVDSRQSAEVVVLGEDVAIRSVRGGSVGVGILGAPARVWEVGAGGKLAVVQLGGPRVVLGAGSLDVGIQDRQVSILQDGASIVRAVESAIASVKPVENFLLGINSSSSNLNSGVVPVVSEGREVDTRAAGLA